jgi:hypothetical protein
MARGPQIFDPTAFEESLRQQGCAESFIQPITGDFRLLVPVVLKDLGEDKLFQIVNSARDELKLREQGPA